jgi:endonuclease-8
VPEGDSLHRAALALNQVLPEQRVCAFELVRRSESTQGLLGQRIEGAEARGKNLLVHFASGVSLHVHLKMNGRIRIGALSEPPPVDRRSAVVVLETDAHRVVINDAPVARLIRRQDLVRDQHFRHLGPDLLGPAFELDEGVRRLRLSNALSLGEALMDQRNIAGIGNVWKSELCFNLKLDPFAPVAAYSDDELRAVLLLGREQMRDNVHGARQRARTIPDPFSPPPFRRSARRERRMYEKTLSVYGRRGEPCYDCGRTIERRTQGDPPRTTYWCPRCQPARSV